MTGSHPQSRQMTYIALKVPHLAALRYPQLSAFPASSQCPEAGHASSNVDSIRLQKVRHVPCPIVCIDANLAASSFELLRGSARPLFSKAEVSATF